MLSHIEFIFSHTHWRLPSVHPCPYLEYVFVSHSGRSHPMRRIYNVVVRFYKLLQHIDKSVCVLISKVSVQFVGVPAHEKLDAFALQYVLKRPV